MYEKVERSIEKKSKAIANSVTQKKNHRKQDLGFVDNRPMSIVQYKMQSQANNSPVSLIQKKENKTGLPDNLKLGMENLSGMSLDNVKVHRNSPKPATLQAHAFTQGNEIYLSSGQEKHLPHELGHVVQQAQGIVKPTTSVNGMAVNDNEGLEKQADVMGSKALQMKSNLQKI